MQQAAAKFKQGARPPVFSPGFPVIAVCLRFSSLGLARIIATAV